MHAGCLMDGGNRRLNICIYATFSPALVSLYDVRLHYLLSIGCL